MPVKERAVKSNLARIDRLRDEQIDYSDIPEFDDAGGLAAQEASDHDSS